MRTTPNTARMMTVHSFFVGFGTDNTNFENLISIPHFVKNTNSYFDKIYCK